METKHMDTTPQPHNRKTVQSISEQLLAVASIISSYTSKSRNELTILLVKAWPPQELQKVAKLTLPDAP